MSFIYHLFTIAQSAFVIFIFLYLFHSLIWPTLIILHFHVLSTVTIVRLNHIYRLLAIKKGLIKIYFINIINLIDLMILQFATAIKL